MISFCLLNLDEIKKSLQILIKHLIDVESYFEDERIQSKYCKENCKSFQLNESESECQSDHRYKTRIISRTPLMIYIEQFLTQREIEHLIELA